MLNHQLVRFKINSSLLNNYAKSFTKKTKKKDVIMKFCTERILSAKISLPFQQTT